jgi:hypothetical protein
MSRDQSANSAGTTTKGTLSVWVKLSAVGTEQVIYERQTDTSNLFKVFFENDALRIATVTGGSYAMFYVTNRLFRDPSAWYHIVVRIDSTDATAGDRQQIWINGVRETSFSTSTDATGDASQQINTGTGNDYIGVRATGSNFFDGYMAEFVWIDGTSYAATSFGEFNEESPTIWQPIDVSGLTFGTNGFYLDFEASDNLGNDANGGTDLTESNLAATDQASDSPTNNFCTMNPLATPSYITLSEGNTVVTGNNATDMVGTWGTIAVPYAGKYYWEGKVGDVTGTYPWFGVGDVSNADTGRNINGGGTGAHSSAFGSPSFAIQNGGALRVGGSTSATYDSYTDDNIISLAIDMDNGASYVAKDGAWMNSGDPTSGASKTGAMTTWTAGTIDGFLPYVGTYYANGSELGIANLNFGCPAYANSSDAADENGYGAFEYAPPSGYYALCTKNLAEFGG